MVCLNRSEHEETKSNQARSGMSSPEIGKPVWDSENILFYLYLVPEHTVWCCMIHTDHTDNRLVLEGNKCTVSCKSVILGEDCSSCTICPTLLQQHYCLSHTAATALPVPSVPHCSNSTTICPTLQQQLCHLSNTATAAPPSVPHCSKLSNSTTICPTLQQQHYYLSHTAATALSSVPHCSNSTTICPTLQQQHYYLSHISATALPMYHLSHTAAAALPSVSCCSNSTTICPTLQQQHYHLSHITATVLLVHCFAEWPIDIITYYTWVTNVQSRDNSLLYSVSVSTGITNTHNHSVSEIIPCSF